LKHLRNFLRGGFRIRQAAAQFGSGSNQTITGYSLGMTYAPYKSLRILAGFSMSPVNEISPGFENAAAQYHKEPDLISGGERCEPDKPLLLVVAHRDHSRLCAETG